MPTTIVSIPLSKIRPNLNNPRKVVTPEAVDLCAASMKAVGQKTPIKVRALPDGNYELIGGHIRLEAAKKLGWEALNGTVLDITAEQAFLEAILDNRDEEMTWLEWYLAIEAFMAQNPGMKQNEVAEILEETPTSINRVVKLLKALNKAAREAILATCKNSSESYVIPEVCARRLGDLDDPARVEKALRVVIDRKMTEPEVVRFVAWIKKGGYPSQYPKKGEQSKSGTTKQRIDPNDPNGELWKPLPTWSSVGIDKESNYDFRGKLDKFGAPYGIYCLLSGMAEYFQRVEKVRNPEVQIPNPYEAKLEELLEKGVREALEANAQKQEEYEAKKSKPFERPAAPQGGHKKNARKLAKGEEQVRDAPALEKREGGPAEPASGERAKRVESVTEGELKTITDLLGNKEVKDNLKNLFGDLFK
jgi:ParB/RepB/Spo0J family partition protein